jgi:hypothetical protein
MSQSPGAEPPPAPLLLIEARARGIHRGTGEGPAPMPCVFECYMLSMVGPAAIPGGWSGGRLKSHPWRVNLGF